MYVGASQAISANAGSLLAGVGALPVVQSQTSSAVGPLAEPASTSNHTSKSDVSPNKCLSADALLQISALQTAHDAVFSRLEEGRRTVDGLLGDVREDLDADLLSRDLDLGYVGSPEVPLRQ